MDYNQFTLLTVSDTNEIEINNSIELRKWSKKKVKLDNKISLTENQQLQLDKINLAINEYNYKNNKIKKKKKKKKPVISEIELKEQEEYLEEYLEEQIELKRFRKRCKRNKKLKIVMNKSNRNILAKYFKHIKIWKDSITDETCSICWNNISNLDSIKTECNHEYCNSCLTDWLQNKKSCPMCRQNIQNSEYEIFNIDEQPFQFSRQYPASMRVSQALALQDILDSGNYGNSIGTYHIGLLQPRLRIPQNMLNIRALR